MKGHIKTILVISYKYLDIDNLRTGVSVHHIGQV